MHSSDFKAELFTQRENFEEGPLRDRKRDLPFLRDKRNQPEFIKDVISLANAARHHGQPAYLLFGMDDKMVLYGLSESLQAYQKEATRKRKGYEWSEQRFEECLWAETIGRCMLGLIRDYIDKRLAEQCKLKHGMVNDQLCAYLLIPPMGTPGPFCSQKPIVVDDKEELKASGCWIRIGESKAELDRQEITEDQPPYCYSYAQVYHPFPSEWKRYFDKLTREMGNAGVIQGYQDLYTESGQRLQEVVQEFLGETELNVLVIHGKAGMGKTTFLQRLVHDLALAGAAEMEQFITQEVFSPPSGYIPLHVSLRGWGNRQNLDVELVSRFNGLGNFYNHRTRTQEKMFEDSRFQWLLCFDGLDEIWTERGQEEFLESLRSFVSGYPQVKVILTARPDVIVPELDDWKTVTIDALRPEQIESYIGVWAQADQVKRVSEFLNSDPEIRELCGIPAFLKVATEILTGMIVPADSEVLEIASAKARQRISAEDKEHVQTHSQTDEVDIGGEQIGLAEIKKLSQESDWDYSTSEAGEYDAPDLPQSDVTELLPEGGEDAPDEFPVSELSKWQFLDRVYHYLWDRERARRLISKTKPIEWFRNTGYLAAFMDGQSTSVEVKEAKRKLGEAKAFNWLLSLGILEIGVPHGRVSFVADITQIYFAASYVLPFIEENQMPEVLPVVRRGKRSFWEGALIVLRALTYDDMSGLELAIAKLET